MGSGSRPHGNLGRNDELLGALFLPGPAFSRGRLVREGRTDRGDPGRPDLRRPWAILHLENLPVEPSQESLKKSSRQVKKVVILSEAKNLVVVSWQPNQSG